MTLQELVNKLCNTLASMPGDTPIHVGDSLEEPTINVTKDSIIIK